MPVKTETANGGMVVRNASFMPETMNIEERTVDVCWSTGASVKRFPWMGSPFNERLSMDPESVDLARLNAGAPVLNTHSSWDAKTIRRGTCSFF